MYSDWYEYKNQNEEAPQTVYLAVQDAFEDNDDGATEMLAIKSTGGVARANGLKLRPDEAKRKHWIIDKKVRQK